MDKVMRQSLIVCYKPARNYKGIVCTFMRFPPVVKRCKVD